MGVKKGIRFSNIAAVFPGGPTRGYPVMKTSTFVPIRKGDPWHMLKGINPNAISSFQSILRAQAALEYAETIGNVISFAHARYEPNPKQFVQGMLLYILICIYNHEIRYNIVMLNYMIKAPLRLFEVLFSSPHAWRKRVDARVGYTDLVA